MARSFFNHEPFPPSMSQDIRADRSKDRIVSLSHEGDDLPSPRQLEIHFEMAIEAAKINHPPVLQFE